MNETQRAMTEINSRRIQAEATADARRAEIEEKIPAIGEIQAQLNSTSVNLLQQIRLGGDDLDARIQKLRSSNEQAQRLIQSLLTQNGYPADYLMPHFTCEKCHDTGYCDGKICDCVHKLATKLAAETLNQSILFKQYTFENFSLDYYKDTPAVYDSMRETYTFCRDYAENFTPTSPSILMSGDTGRGKTHLSLAIANEVLMQGYSVLYDSTINFLTKIEAEHFGRTPTETDTLDAVLSCDLLILDDLGTEMHSTFYQSTIYNIVNTRMNRMRPTIISTNYNFKEITANYEKRLTSRILSTYECLRFDGPDIRITKKRAKI